MKCAVYRFHDTDGQLLYIGSSVNPEARRKYHEKFAPWFPTVASRSIVWFDDMRTARIAESLAIAHEKPLMNVNLQGKVRGAAAFIDQAGKDNLAKALGVTRAAVRNAHWRDRLPACWAYIVALYCIEHGLNCRTGAFNWAGKPFNSDTCISERMFPEIVSKRASA